MTTLFRHLSYYADVPPFSFPGLETFSAAAAPRGTWPAVGGGAGRTGRAGEPLVSDTFTVEWRVSLGAAARPDSILVGCDRIVVNGAKQRAFWQMDGKEVGFVERDVGAVFFDVAGQRLLAHGEEGVAVVSLDAHHESTMSAAAPSDGTTRDILQGPGALVLVSSRQPPHGAAHAVVESLRVRDYHQAKNGRLYGIEPLAGITRDADASVVAAAGAMGPVFATPEGIDWRDWQLRSLGQTELSARPLALSVDERGQAHLLVDDGGWTHLLVIPWGGSPLVDLTLPVDDGAFRKPPLVTPSGQIYLTSPDAIVAISPAGQRLWRHDRSLSAAGTLSGNGLLLVGGHTLDAFTDNGRPVTLWHPPSPIITPPVLANDRLLVATAEELFVLRPDMPR